MKVAVVSGGRADFGLLAPLMERIQGSEKLELQLILTGAHLLEEFRSTKDEAREHGLSVAWRVPELSSATTGADVAEQVGDGTKSFLNAMSRLSPGVLVLLGDRYELLAAAAAAFFLDIPVLHIHGGEVTEGAFDDVVRHVVSKFAKVHAVAAPAYRDRLIRAGEQPQSVNVVGGLGVDVLDGTKLMGREQLGLELGVSLDENLLVVTYHPVTAAKHDTDYEVASLLQALEAFPTATVIFTAPNADPEHQRIISAITEAVESHRSWHFFISLGSTKYLSLIALASAVVGNSSSGILEAPTLGVPTVNIGARQSGRLFAQSVISCAPDAKEIEASIRTALSKEFRGVAASAKNPYGDPGAAKKILHLLETVDFATLGAKVYFDG